MSVLQNNLEKQLRTKVLTLIQKYGTESVRTVVYEICALNLNAAIADCDGRTAPASGVVKLLPKKPRAYTKPTAVSIVAKKDLPAAHQRWIKVLAERFDQKLFLPRASDIRMFFEAYDSKTQTFRHRSDAFRQVLMLLENLPEEELQKMVDSNAHGGPTSLAPISIAIREFGEDRFRQKFNVDLLSTGSD